MYILMIRKNEADGKKTAVMVLLSVIAIVIVLALIFLAIGVSPVTGLWKIVTTSFGSGYDFSETLVKTTPIIFTGLAVSCALKMKLWNIGAEGQLFMGAFGAVWAEQAFSGLPGFLVIPLMMLSAMVCGGVFGAIAGVLKKTLNVNEILTTLMMNYVAISLVNYFIYGPWRDPENPGFPITARFAPAARLPQAFNTRLHLGFVFALVTAVILWFVIDKTSWGYEIRAAGESTGGAKYAGIPVGRNILLVLLISGAVAGLAGMCEVSGLHYKLQPGNISSNYGSLGIIVAWLSGAHSLAVVCTAFCAGILLIGTESLQITMGVSSDMVQIIIGLLLISILVCKYFSMYRVSLRKGEGKEESHG